MLLQKICVALLLLVLFASCGKVIETDPSHSLDGTQNFKKIEDYELALIGAYSLFRQDNYYSSVGSSGYGMLPDVLGDNFRESAESLGNYSIYSDWNYTPNATEVGLIWLDAYKIIMQANVVLRNLDQFASSKPQAVNRIKGQALAIRAMVHFDVLRYWVTDFDRNSNAPGIPYIDQFDYEVKPGRGTVKGTYDKIEADLLQALALLSDTDDEINSGSQRVFIDVDVVHAILARMYLYANDMDKAIEQSTLLIDNYPLSKQADFPGIWQDIPNQELIWSIPFNSGEGEVGSIIYFVQGRRASYAPDSVFLSKYDDVNDIRYNAYFKDLPKADSSRIVFTKYLSKAAAVRNPDGLVNFKVFRSAEMYLIRAEAYARKGGTDEALGLEDLNTLRTARIKNYVPGSETGAALINAIAQERRKELVGEGHRWFDIKRTTRTIERDKCDPDKNRCSIVPDDREWAWPIPQAEILANPAIKPQNPKY